MLADCFVNFTQAGFIWEEGTQLRNCLHRTGLWKGPGGCEVCHLWASGSEVHKKANWASHEEQARKQRSFTVPASVPASGLLPGALALPSLSDLSCNMEYSLSSPAVFGRGVYHGNRKPTRTVSTENQPLQC